MDTKKLALWIDAKVCRSCHEGYTCEEYDCEQARTIADLLNRMVPFKGRDADGNEVAGWLVPE